MKRMRKVEAEALARATSPWMRHHFGKGEIGGFWDPADDDFSTAPKEGEKAFAFSFCGDIPRCIKWAKQAPRVEGMFFNDCHSGEATGMAAYGGLKDLADLRYLTIRDSRPLDGETLRMIAGLPRLEGLALALQRIDSGKSLRELAACRSLRALMIGVEDLSDEEGPWVEDLQFLSGLPLLENLDVSDCHRVDLSRFVLPPALKVFTVPNYTATEVKRRFREKCAVIKGGLMHSPCRNRFGNQPERAVPKNRPKRSVPKSDSPGQATLF